MPITPDTTTPSRGSGRITGPVRPSTVCMTGGKAVMAVWAANGWAGLILVVVLWTTTDGLVLLTYPAAAVLAVVGIALAQKRARGEQLVHPYLNARRTWSGACCLALLSVVWAYQFGGWWGRAGLVVDLAAIELLVWRPAGTESTAWWSHDRLVAIFVKAKVLPPVKDGEQPHQLHYRGTPKVDDDGTVEITVELPAGHPGSTAEAKRAGIAASIPGAVEQLVTVEHNDDDPATAVTIRVDVPGKLSQSRPAALPDRTLFREPYVLGRDRRGNDVKAMTRGRHTGVFGMTGAGKTVLGRRHACQAILDPEVPIAALVFKDDVDDWAPLERVCGSDLYAGGLDPATLRKAAGILEQLYELNESRKRAGRDVGDVLVVIEEWFAGRQAMQSLDAGLATKCDGYVSVLLATMRSRNMAALVLSQRSMVTHLPSDQRSNIVQRFQGKSRRGDVANALDVQVQELPPIPKEVGHFLMTDWTVPDPLHIVIDYLDDQAFVDACDRGLALRGGHPLPLPIIGKASLVKATPVDAQPELEVAPVDRLGQAVLDLLDDGPALASAILGDLPEAIAPPTPQALGVELARLRDSGLVHQARIGKSMGWHLGPAPQDPRQAPAKAPQAPAAAPARGRRGGSQAVPHARPALAKHLATVGAPDPKDVP